MKVTREELNSIIQEELQKAVEQGEITQEQLAKIEEDLKGAIKAIPQAAKQAWQGIKSGVKSGYQTVKSAYKEPSKKNGSVAEPSVASSIISTGTKTAAETPAQDISSSTEEQPQSPVQQAPAQLEKPEVSTFEAKYDDILSFLQGELESQNVDRKQLQSFLIDLKSKLNLDLQKRNTKLVLREQLEEINITDMFQKHFRDLDIGRLRKILKKLKNYLSIDPKFVDDQITPSSLGIDFQWKSEPPMELEPSTRQFASSNVQPVATTSPVPVDDSDDVEATKTQSTATTSPVPVDDSDDIEATKTIQTPIDFDEESFSVDDSAFTEPEVKSDKDKPKKLAGKERKRARAAAKVAKAKEKGKLEEINEDNKIFERWKRLAGLIKG